MVGPLTFQLSAEKEAPQSMIPTKGWPPFAAAAGEVARIPSTPAGSGGQVATGLWGQEDLTCGRHGSRNGRYSVGPSFIRAPESHASLTAAPSTPSPAAL